MTPDTVSLGLTERKFPPGAHVCQIFSDDNEWQDSLLRFLTSGRSAGEKVACFSERADEALVMAPFLEQGLDCASDCQCGALSFSKTSEVYFQDGRFDPGRMLALLTQFYRDSLKDGYPGARVIGEMTPEVQTIPGGSRLLEYESKVSLLLREHPVTAVCQYDARKFDGATILDILKVHPFMIVRGSVVQNPFFIPPEEFLTR